MLRGSPNRVKQNRLAPRTIVEGHGSHLVWYRFRGVHPVEDDSGGQAKLRHRRRIRANPVWGHTDLAIYAARPTPPKSTSSQLVIWATSSK
jgi:hypothetical protein